MAETMRIGGEWGKMWTDPRGMRIRRGGVLTDEMLGRPKTGIKRPKLSRGDVVTILELTPEVKNVPGYNDHPGWARIAVGSRVGWVSRDCLEPTDCEQHQ